jgi:predicted N-acetyltransferase YhbS
MSARSIVLDEAGNSRPVLTFGPLGVLPSLQKQGIGAALVRHACTEARTLGHTAVLIYGDPEYYRRLGFLAAEEFQISTGEGVFHPALQALELKPGALSGLRGRFLESPAYHFAPEQAAAFDCRFPRRRNPSPKASGVSPVLPGFPYRTDTAPFPAVLCRGLFFHFS